MIFYDCSTAPSPRRVRIFIAEKGMEVPTVQVDLRGGEHLEPAFRAKNPRCTVPVLELDDGTCLGDIVAIQRYLEEVQPDPPLLGRDAKDKAVVGVDSVPCRREELEHAPSFVRRCGEYPDSRSRPPGNDAPPPRWPHSKRWVFRRPIARPRAPNAKPSRSSCPGRSNSTGEFVQNARRD